MNSQHPKKLSPLVPKAHLEIRTTEKGGLDKFSAKLSIVKKGLCLTENNEKCMERMKSKINESDFCS